MPTSILIIDFLILGFALYCLGAWYISDFLIFPKFPASYSENETFKPLVLPDGSSISTVYLPNPEAEFTIFYSHGNGEDLGMIYDRLRDIREAGFSVFAYEYPGYGRSTGNASLGAVYRALHAAFKHLTETLNTSADKIIAYGYSLGGGPSTELAHTQPLAGLILENTFVSAFRVKTHIPIVPIDKFRNLTKIDKINMPLLIFHATNDEVVPFWHGKALYDKALEPKTNAWIEGALHCNLAEIAGQEYWTHIKEFANKIGSHQNARA